MKKNVEDTDVESASIKSTCCGGAAPGGTDACCLRDAEAKSAGQDGCGCTSTNKPDALSPPAICC